MTAKISVKKLGKTFKDENTQQPIDGGGTGTSLKEKVIGQEKKT